MVNAAPPAKTEDANCLRDRWVGDKPGEYFICPNALGSGG